MVLNGKEGLECKVHIDRIHLEHISEYKYFGCVLDKSGTDGAECSRKVAIGRRLQMPSVPKLIPRICSLSVLNSCIKH